MVTNVTGAVTPQLNRAANNILWDLRSMLEGRQYADAARILVSCARRLMRASFPPLMTTGSSHRFQRCCGC